MLPRDIFIPLVIFFIVPRGSAKDLRLIFWIDPLQKYMYEDIAKSLKDYRTLDIDVNIKDAVIEVDHYVDDDSVNMKKFCEVLSSHGVSLILDYTYIKWEKGVELVERTGIPYMRVDRILSPFMQALNDFLKKKGGNEVVMIFESLQARDEGLYHIIDGFDFRSMLLSAQNDGDYLHRIKAIRPSPTYIAIFATASRMNDIFGKVLTGDLFQRPAEWNFVFLDGRDKYFKYKKEVENATRITFNPKTICKTIGKPDSYCTSGFSWSRVVLYEIISKLAAFSVDTLPPLAISCNMSEMPSMVSQWNVMDLLDSSALLYQITRPDIFSENQLNPISYIVNLTMNFYTRAHEAVTDLAIWYAGELIQINETLTKPKRFMRIGVTEAFPWNFYVRDPVTGNISRDEHGKPLWQGYCNDLIIALAEKMNFEYELVEPRKGKFGKRDPKTRKWDGVVGDLVSGETTFAVTSLKMYTDREEVIDFVAPYFETTGISIVIRKPVKQTSLFKFMTVLRVEVWMSILGALISTSVMLWFLDKYSPYSYRNNRESYDQPCREFTLRECFWFSLTSFTPQGGGEAPKAVSGRVLVAAYWLFVVLMLATFTANLAAFLTVERMQTPVQSLEQLSRQSRINYTVVEGSDVHKYFINMKFAEDTLYRMWKEAALNESEDYHKFRVWDYPIKEQYGNILSAINSSIPVKNAAEGYRKVSEHIHGDFAFIHDSSEIKYELTTNCNLTEIGEVFGEQPYAVAIQQGNNLGDELVYSLLELQKDHYLEELRAQYWNYSRLKCPLTEEQEGISLDSLGGVFIATLFGLGVSMVTLVGEILYYKHKERREEEKMNAGRPTIRQVIPALRSMGAWHTRIGLVGTSQKTPPPSFDVATNFKSDILRTVTLGSEFKPRRKAVRRANIHPHPDELPPYLE